MTFCTSCGREHAGRFCTGCGNPAPAEDVAATAVLPQQPAHAPWERADDAGTGGLAGTAGPAGAGRVPQDLPQRDRTGPLLALLTVLLLLVATGAFLVGYRDSTQAVVAPTTSAGPSPAADPGTATDQPPQPTQPVEPTAEPTQPPSSSPATPSAEPAPPTSSPSRTRPMAPAVTPPAAEPPLGTPFEVVVLASKSSAEGGRAAAEALVDDIQAAGYPAMVFSSEGYTSLRCCYWVAAAGPFGSVAAAQSAAGVLRSRSSLFSTAYDRCVGAAYQCPA